MSFAVPIKILKLVVTVRLTGVYLHPIPVLWMEGGEETKDLEPVVTELEITRILMEITQ